MAIKILGGLRCWKEQKTLVTITKVKLSFVLRDGLINRGNKKVEIIKKLLEPCHCLPLRASVAPHMIAVKLTCHMETQITVTHSKR